MNDPTNDTPASVPPSEMQPEAKQAGEADDRWSWVERSVWTKRMLTSLCNGVKGGKWFSLMDKVFSWRNLDAAHQRVVQNRGAAGVDHQTIEMFGRDPIKNLQRLEAELISGRYAPRAIRRVWIPKPGSAEKRPLGIPTIRDRIVQTALRNVLEPIFEKDFAEHSYGFRPGRSCHDAIGRVDELLAAGYRYVVDADLKSYFDTIPWDRLLERIADKISDGRVLALIEQFLSQGVLDDLREWAPTEGSPQGAVISPLLSNIYLDPLDHLMAEQGFQMVRYADDFVILCRSAEEARLVLERVREWTAAAGLTLHPQKTQIVDAVTDGFEFLGYRFVSGTKVPRDKSIARLKETVRQKTRRKQGRSLQAVITDLNRSLVGWFQYFRLSNSTPFRPLDGWIRMRLRSILRKQAKRRGRGCGQDHHRYRNAFFEQLGLFSLVSAHACYRQSAFAGNH